LKHILKLKEFYMLAFVVFIVNAIFNGVSTWVEPIVRPKGMDIGQAGIIGGLLMLGGIVGLFVFPPLSDKTRKRKPVFLWGVILSIPFLVAMTLLNNFALMAVASALLGFFMMGITPVALQYGTELLYPAPEGTSMGLITLAGQLSVVVLTFMGMSYEATGSFTQSLLILAGFMALSAVVLSMMKESTMIQQVEE
jgi:MFS family permease